MENFRGHGEGLHILHNVTIVDTSLDRKSWHHIKSKLVSGHPHNKIEFFYIDNLRRKYKEL